MNNFQKAAIYTFPYPKLRKLILFLIWEKALKDFEMKTNLIRFASDINNVYEKVQEEDFAIQCLFEEMQFKIKMSLVLEEILIKIKVSYYKAIDVYEAI